jgi:hypothetical protein
MLSLCYGIFSTNSMEKDDNMRHLTHSPLRLRDVTDVHGYVLDAVALLAPAASSHRDALHAHGVRAVLRVERALPPGVPLRPVLDAVLPARLETLDRSLSGADAALAAAA